MKTYLSAAHRIASITPTPFSATVTGFGVKINRRARGWVAATIHARYFVNFSTGLELTGGPSSEVATAVLSFLKACPYVEVPHSPLVERCRASLREGDWVLEATGDGRCSITFSNDLTAPTTEAANATTLLALIQRAAKQTEAN